LAFGDLFQKKIQQYLLNNKHAVFITYVPDEKYTKELIKKEVDKLSSIKNQLSELDRKNIEFNSIKLKENQDSFQDPEILPKLNIEDIPSSIQNTQNFILKKIEDVEIFQHQYETNGLTFLRLYRKVSVPQHLIQLLPFFASV
jgi:presequence protease